MALMMIQPGMFLMDPNREKKDLRTAEAYVDDASQGIDESSVTQKNQRNHTDLTLLQASTGANQAFERLLSLTGGKPAIEKTIFYYLI